MLHSNTSCIYLQSPKADDHLDGSGQFIEI